jgi:glyceraldehyde 3-phosphate dehydrogenase
MAVRVGINGFGRIGRNVFRAAYEAGADIEWVGVNDIGDPKTFAHLLKYDSNYGPFPGEVEDTSTGFLVDGDEIRFISEKDPAALPWGELGADVVIESTGLFTDRENAAKHLAAGAKKVLISAPATEPDVTVALGVNFEQVYDRTRHDVISNASCTTNCLAPVAKVLNDAIGIHHGFMTTIHSYTGDQPTLDTMHKDLYRARAAALSMIPTTTGAAKAVGLVLPELKGKLDGSAIRVPTPNVSVVDLKFVASRATSKEEINAAIVAAANGPLKGILGYTDKPNVSSDFNHDSHSSVFHLDQTKVIEGNFVRILSWYDNEWGFSNRMGDTAVALAKLI